MAMATEATPAATIHEVTPQAQDPKEHPRAVEYGNLLESIQYAEYKVSFWESTLAGKESGKEHLKTPLVSELEKWADEADELWGKMRRTKRKAAELVEANDTLLALDKVLGRLDNIIADSKEALRSLKQQKFSMEQNYPHVLIAVGYQVEKPAPVPGELPLDLPTPAEAELQDFIPAPEIDPETQAYREGRIAYAANKPDTANPYKPKAEKKLNMRWAEGWADAKNGINEEALGESIADSPAALFPIPSNDVEAVEDGEVLEAGEADAGDAPEETTYRYLHPTLGTGELYVDLNNAEGKWGTFFWIEETKEKSEFVHFDLPLRTTAAEAQANLDKFAADLNLGKLRS